MLSTIEKDRFKYKQSFDIVNSYPQDPQEAYDTLTHVISKDTADPLQKSYLWMDDNFYNNDFVNKWILDAGCGLGPFVLRQEKRGNKVIGVDFYKAKVNYLQKIKDYFPEKNFHVYESSIYRLPFYGKWFDSCHSIMMIEHLTEPGGGLKEMCKSAKMVTGIIHMGLNKEESPYHQYFYTPEKVNDILAPVFETYKVEWIDDLICACFIGKPKKEFSATTIFNNKYISNMINMNVVVDTVEAQDVCINKVENQPYLRREIVDDYLQCLDTAGEDVLYFFENPFTPIKVIYKPWEDSYQILGDGTHRINALKEFGYFKTIRMMVTTLQKVN